MAWFIAIVGIVVIIWFVSAVSERIREDDAREKAELKRKYNNLNPVQKIVFDTKMEQFHKEQAKKKLG